MFELTNNIHLTAQLTACRPTQHPHPRQNKHASRSYSLTFVEIRKKRPPPMLISTRGQSHCSRMEKQAPLAPAKAHSAKDAPLHFAALRLLWLAYPRASPCAVRAVAHAGFCTQHSWARLIRECPSQIGFLMRKSANIRC